MNDKPACYTLFIPRGAAFFYMLGEKCGLGETGHGETLQHFGHENGSGYRCGGGGPPFRLWNAQRVKV